MIRRHSWTNPAQRGLAPGYSFPARRLPDWYSEAKCAGFDPDAFFPDKGDIRTASMAAKAICSSCPVATQCLKWALDNEDLNGIWAGTTPNDRRALLGRPLKGHVA